MAFTDFGLYQFGSFIKGDSPVTPTAMAFGNGSGLFNGSTYYLNGEFARKNISWAWNGNTARGTVLFGSNEANGSSFFEMGIGSGTALGSNLWTRDLSAVGSKLSSYALELVFDFRAKRF